jgi:ethanolamine transporter EutH
MNSPRWRSRGEIKKVAAAVVAALALGGTFAYRALRDGASDFSYIFFMSLAGVVAIAIVAPRFFTKGGDRPPWERTRPAKDESSNDH